MNNELKVDLVDFIVSERKKQGAEILAQRDENKPTLNVTTIFQSSDNPEGIWDKGKLNHVFQDFGREDLYSLKAALESMKRREKITTTPFPRVDKNGIPYYWVRIVGKNGSQEFKLPIFDGLDRLLSIYLFDMAIIEIDFDELYHESLK